MSDNNKNTLNPAKGRRNPTTLGDYRLESLKQEVDKSATALVTLDGRVYAIQRRLTKEYNTLPPSQTDLRSYSKYVVKQVLGSDKMTTAQYNRASSYVRAYIRGYVHHNPDFDPHNKEDLAKLISEANWEADEYTHTLRVFSEFTDHLMPSDRRFWPEFEFVKRSGSLNDVKTVLNPLAAKNPGVPIPEGSAWEKPLNFREKAAEKLKKLEMEQVLIPKIKNVAELKASVDKAKLGVRASRMFVTADEGETVDKEVQKLANSLRNLEQKYTSAVEANERNSAKLETVRVEREKVKQTRVSHAAKAAARTVAHNPVTDTVHKVSRTERIRNHNKAAVAEFLASGGTIKGAELPIKLAVNKAAREGKKLKFRVGKHYYVNYDTNEFMVSKVRAGGRGKSSKPDSYWVDSLPMADSPLLCVNLSWVDDMCMSRAMNLCWEANGDAGFGLKELHSWLVKTTDAKDGAPYDSGLLTREVKIGSKMLNRCWNTGRIDSGLIATSISNQDSPLTIVVYNNHCYVALSSDFLAHCGEAWGGKAQSWSDFRVEFIVREPVPDVPVAGADSESDAIASFDQASSSDEDTQATGDSVASFSLASVSRATDLDDTCIEVVDDAPNFPSDAHSTNWQYTLLNSATLVHGLYRGPAYVASKSFLPFAAFDTTDMYLPQYVEFTATLAQPVPLDWRNILNTGTAPVGWEESIAHVTVHTYKTVTIPDLKGWVTGIIKGAFHEGNWETIMGAIQGVVKALKLMLSRRGFFKLGGNVWALREPLTAEVPLGVLMTCLHSRAQIDSADQAGVARRTIENYTRGISSTQNARGDLMSVVDVIVHAANICSAPNKEVREHPSETMHAVFGAFPEFERMWRENSLFLSDNEWILWYAARSLQEIQRLQNSASTGFADTNDLRPVPELYAHGVVNLSRIDSSLAMAENITVHYGGINCTVGKTCRYNGVSSRRQYYPSGGPLKVELASDAAPNCYDISTAAAQMSIGQEFNLCIQGLRDLFPSMGTWVRAGGEPSTSVEFDAETNSANAKFWAWVVETRFKMNDCLSGCKSKFASSYEGAHGRAAKWCTCCRSKFDEISNSLEGTFRRFTAWLWIQLRYVVAASTVAAVSLYSKLSELASWVGSHCQQAPRPKMEVPAFNGEPMSILLKSHYDSWLAMLRTMPEEDQEQLPGSHLGEFIVLKRMFHSWCKVNDIETDISESKTMADAPWFDVLVGDVDTMELARDLSFVRAYYKLGETYRLEYIAARLKSASSQHASDPSQ